MTTHQPSSQAGIQSFQRPDEKGTEPVATVADVERVANEYEVDDLALLTRAFAEPSDVLRRMTVDTLRDLAHEIRSSQA